MFLTSTNFQFFCFVFRQFNLDGILTDSFVYSQNRYLMSPKIFLENDKSNNLVVP